MINTFPVYKVTAYFEFSKEYQKLLTLMSFIDIKKKNYSSFVLDTDPVIPLLEIEYTSLIKMGHKVC